MKMTPAHLTEVFRIMKLIRNRNKVIIEYHDGAVSVTYLLQASENGKYELYDEAYGVEKFMEIYNISTEEDIQLIDRSHLWIRYLEEAAELIYTNGDSNTIHFRKFRNRTMVYSLDMNYYNEIYRVLTMTDQFEQYIIQSYEELEGLSYKN